MYSVFHVSCFKPGLIFRSSCRISSLNSERSTTDNAEKSKVPHALPSELIAKNHRSRGSVTARRFDRDIIIVTLAQARAFLLEPLVRRSKKVGESDQRARRDDADT